MLECAPQLQQRQPNPAYMLLDPSVHHAGTSHALLNMFLMLHVSGAVHQELSRRNTVLLYAYARRGAEEAVLGYIV